MEEVVTPIDVGRREKYRAMVLVNPDAARESSSESDEDESSVLKPSGLTLGDHLAGVGRDLMDVESTLFHIIVGIVITFNCVLQGAETFDSNSNLREAEAACTVIFTIELAMRLRYHGFREYFSNFSRCFDCVLVVISVGNSFVMPMMVSLKLLKVNHHSNIASVITFFRSFRILRVMRLFTVFTELSILLTAFGEAMKTVIWIGVIGFVVDYMFAVTMVNVVRHVDWGEDADQIDAWFGNLWRSMRTFFIIMTLAEWDTIVLVMEKYIYPPAIYFAAIIYILITAFSLVSLVTGVLSEKLIAVQLDDRETQRKALEEEHMSAQQQLELAFKCFDGDGDGKISAAEFSAVSEEDVRAALRDLELIAQIKMSREDFKGFIELVIDKMGETGAVDKERIELPIEAMVDALLSTRGPAQAHKLWKLTSVVHTVKMQGVRSEERLSGIEGRLSGLECKIEKLCQALALK